MYFLLSGSANFKQDYLAAWRQHDEKCIHIYVQDENLMIPIPADSNDEMVLKRIRGFYRLIEVDRGVLELIFPKDLERIDHVEVWPLSSIS